MLLEILHAPATIATIGLVAILIAVISKSGLHWDGHKFKILAKQVDYRVLSDIKRLEYQKFLLLHIGKTADIMRVCDDQYTCIANYMRDKWRKYLQTEFKIEDANNHMAYINFSDALTLTKENVMIECRRMIRENNFLLKESAGEKDKYCDFQTNVLFDLVPTNVTEKYRYNNPTRQELREWALKNLDINYIKSEIRKAVLYCFIASKTFQNECDKIDNEIKVLEEKL